jgi:CRP/FNR family transcriptional regulator, cyclic AMP receptor protein
MSDLMGKAKTIRFTRKTVVDSEANTNALLIIFYGNLSVRRVDAEFSNEVTIQIEEFRAGFGEIALLTDELRSAAVITLQKTLFGVIRKNDFNAWLMNYLDAKFAFLPVLAEKFDS